MYLTVDNTHIIFDPGYNLPIIITLCNVFAVKIEYTLYAIGLGNTRRYIIVCGY